jgi:predicted nucleic acid-binding protein
MKSKFFVDTNILAYAADFHYRRKRDAAREIIKKGFESSLMVLSTQVLQELYVTLVNNLGIDKLKARSIIEYYHQFEIIHISPGFILKAIDLNIIHSLSLWDALIVTAAIESNCLILFSENFQHSKKFDNLTVINPFK